MFESVFSDTGIVALNFFISLATALLCGIVYAFLSCCKTKSSLNFMIATALIPMTVAAVIALVNGNLGVGVAIAGAFGLVRFRSAPGTAREIAVIFTAMAAGLAFGMGYLAYGSMFLIVTGLLLFIFEIIVTKTKFADKKEKILKITIPETLDYTSVFDDIFDRYTNRAEPEGIKSTNMGSMFRLTYRIELKNRSCEKPLLDAIRTRNGNLEISCNCVDFEEYGL